MALAEGTVPDDRVIDGRNVWPVVSGVRGAKSPHDAIYLREDIGEQRDVIDRYPEIAGRLRGMMESFHENVRENTRPAGIAD